MIVPEFIADKTGLFQAFSFDKLYLVLGGWDGGDGGGLQGWLSSI